MTMRPRWNAMCVVFIVVHCHRVSSDIYAVEDIVPDVVPSMRRSEAKRSRREPAIWGEPAPDYSGVVLDGTVRNIHALLFVDSKITNFYRYNIPFMKAQVLRMIEEANTYFYQIDLRIIVLDILQTERNDLSLYSFEEYRKQRLRDLPAHDFAALISYRYGGGLAFVGGMCTQKAVLLCGFYPNNPEAMGSIFFHEVAHLVGVPHRNASDQLYIENCFCNNIIARNPSKSSRIGCLKIPGYDHDCTVQQMANRLHRNPCLDSAKQQKLISAEMIQKALPICGNGIVEGSEECDCGLEKFCWDPNCIPNECKRIVNEWVLYLALISIGVIMTILFATFMYRRFVRRYPQTARISMKFGPSITSRCFGFRHSYRNRKSNYTRSLRQTGIMIAQKGKINPASIVVLVDSPRRNIPLRRNSTKRPDHPPPPPPLRSSRTPYQSENLNDKSYVEQSSTVSKWHPPIPEKPRSLASAFHDNSALTHDEYEIPNSVRTRNSVLAVSVNEGHPTAYDSASRNFDDFDDDFEWESDDEMELDCSSHRQLDPIVEAPIPSSDVRISAQYTPVIPKDFRDDEEHMKMNEANAVSENSTGAPRQSDSVRNLGNFFGVTNDSRVNLASFLLRNHSMEFRSRLRNNDSFNSSDSFGEKRTASDDTVSTGLSEDDKSLQAQ